MHVKKFVSTLGLAVCLFTSTIAVAQTSEVIPVLPNTHKINMNNLTAYAVFARLIEEYRIMLSTPGVSKEELCMHVRTTTHAALMIHDADLYARWHAKAQTVCGDVIK